jgi:hypothetical protein
MQPGNYHIFAPPLSCLLNVVVHVLAGYVSYVARFLFQIVHAAIKED